MNRPGIRGLGRRLWTLWASGKVEFGCDYCADGTNRFYGHVTQIGTSEERGMILLRCPRCGALYENSAGGPDRTRRLAPDEAAKLYPDSFG